MTGSVDAVARSISARGEDAAIAPSGGESRSVRGVFTRTVDHEAVGDNDALRNRTALLVSAEDAAGVSVGDRVDARGKNWTVRDIEGNADYALTLVLQESADET